MQKLKIINAKIVNEGEIQNRGLGMDVDIFNEKGQSIKNEKGELVCKKPFPSMPIKFWNDKGDIKYKSAYIFSSVLLGDMYWSIVPKSDISLSLIITSPLLNVDVS